MGEVKKIKAIHNTDCLCYKCLQKKDKVREIHIGSSGYGSCFDNMSTSLQLCDECYAESTKDKPIWNMEKVYGQMHFEGGYCYPSRKELSEDQVVDEYIDRRYRYDYEMDEYLNNLPLESRELVFNRNAYGACAGYNMDAQDWIDYQLGILSHKKCKKYGMHSFDEKRAYEERFPSCQYPAEIIYNDGSKGCWCLFGAHGKLNDGVVSVGSNISSQCYKCKYYKQRTTPVISVKDSERADYDLYVEYQLKKDILEQKFGEMLKGVV